MIPSNKKSISLFLVFSLTLLLRVPNAEALTNGQNAVNAVGAINTTTNTPVYTQNRANNGANVVGFSTPAGIAIDTTNHRLFVSDNGNNRVMVFNLNASDQLVDYSADFVLGQTDLISENAATAQNGLSGPEGLAYDATNQRLFVVDRVNHRVMVFDVNSIGNGENAANVLGQADFTTATSGLTQSKLNNPKDLAYDSANNRLFVSDSNNNRVLSFDVNSITNGENAANVLGQANFTSNSSGTTQGTFNKPVGLAYNSAGGLLFVSDQVNNRVMVFDVASISNGENAANVLGQANFTSGAASSPTQSRLDLDYSPNEIGLGLAFDGGGNRLFAADALNNRVLVFDVASISNGENAANVLGQANFTSDDPAATQSNFNGGLFFAFSFDAVNNRLFVGSSGSNRVLVFDTATITNGENAVNVAGQLDDTGTITYTKSGMNNGANTFGLMSPSAMTIDTVRHLLFVSDEGNARVLVFNLNSRDELTDYQADFVLGQADFSGSLMNRGVTVDGVTSPAQNSLGSPRSLVYDSANQRLFVADNGNSRVTVFDVATITNGENAAYVLGSANFTTFKSPYLAVSQSNLNVPIGLAYDSANQRLFVADAYDRRVLVFDVTAITNGENAVNVLGQTDFVTATSSTTQSKFNSLLDLVYDSANQRLFAVDTSSNRVMVFDVAAITNGENAVNVLGQTDFVTATSGTTQSKFDNPSSLAYDSSNQRLFVADRVGNRVMAFDLVSITDGESAAYVLGQTDFTTGTSGVTQSKFNDPFGIFVHPSTGLIWVGDNQNNRLLAFDSYQAAGGSGSSVKNIQGQIGLKLSLGGHRDNAFLRLVNQLLKGERMIRDRVTIHQLLLNRADGLKEFTTMAEILDRPAFRATLLQLYAENPEIRSILRGQQSDRMLLEVWPAGDRSAPSFSVVFSTNIFGEASVSFPSLPAGSYDFTVRKPFGLRQSLNSQALSDSMTLVFPDPIRVGDLNGDGLINVIDFKAFLENFGNVENDFNEDGVADLQDVVEFLRSIE